MRCVKLTFGGVQFTIKSLFIPEITYYVVNTRYEPMVPVVLYTDFSSHPIYPTSGMMIVSRQSDNNVEVRFISRSGSAKYILPMDTFITCLDGHIIKK